MLGVHGVVAERLDGVHVEHVLEVAVVPLGDLLDLVGGAEAVEEVDERHATLDGGEVRHGREVHDLLHVALGEHGEAGLATGHDVGLVTEDVEGLRGHATSGDVEDARQVLASDLVHVRDHEQQALRRRVGRREGAGAQGAVDGAGGATLGLHLDDVDGGAEDILHALGGPLVDVVGHGARRGDRVDARHLRVRIRDVCGGLVAVHCLELTRHILSFYTRSRGGPQSGPRPPPPWRQPSHTKSPSAASFPARREVTLSTAI